VDVSLAMLACLPACVLAARLSGRLPSTREKKRLRPNELYLGSHLSTSSASFAFSFRSLQQPPPVVLPRHLILRKSEITLVVINHQTHRDRADSPYSSRRSYVSHYRPTAKLKLQLPTVTGTKLKVSPYLAPNTSPI